MKFPGSFDSVSSNANLTALLLCNGSELPDYFFRFAVMFKSSKILGPR